MSRLGSALALLALPLSLAAQLIGVRTVPIAAGDQFAFLPTRSAAMGGVSVALADDLGDPFRNPAAGARGQARFFGSPTFFTVANGNGAVRSLPVGAVFASPAWFGGVAITLQQVVAADQWGWWGPVPVLESSAPEPTFGPDRSAANLYAAGLVGRRFGTVAVGVSASYADLSAVHGVELLYAGSVGMQQFGDATDLRAGLAWEGAGGRSLELVGVHNRLGMTHDVTYVETLYDSLTGIWTTAARVETNLDQTRTTGLHATYRVPIAAGWTLGLVGTGNHKDHPKIPNYDLANIPRDPGTTWAWNVGLGVAHTRGDATFAAEVILEPIRSHTWADAAADTVSVGGTPIPSGGITVDNHFRFTNALFRVGLTHDLDPVTAQVGLQVRSIRYRLNQEDRIRETFRRQNEDWMEWTPTWGVAVRLAEFELRYAGRVTSGTGRPSVGGWFGVGVERAAADFVVAPSGPLNLQEAKVVTHQFAVVVPIR